jgi:DNA modification methylase
MTVTLLRGDALHLPIADHTVDLVVTSPPFLNLRSYQDGGKHYAGQIGTGTQTAWLEDLWAVTAECKRVLKPTGSIFVELGDSYTNKSLNDSPHRYSIGCTDKLGLLKRAEIIWDRPNGLPESVTDRVRRSHSVWFHFTVQPRYFSAVDEIREAHQAPSRSTYSTGPSGGNREITRGKFGSPEVRDFAQSTLGKLPGSVWSVPSQPLTVPPELGVDHFAAFPMEWPRRLIAGWSPAGICECGFLLGSTYDNGMLGVRRSLRAKNPQRRGRDEVLQQEVLQPPHVEEPRIHEVPTPDDSRLHRGLVSEPSDGAEIGLSNGAPTRNGRASGTPATAVGGCPSQERGQNRQPDREPGTAREDRARPAAETFTQAVRLPSLRRHDPDLRHPRSCPNCGSDSFQPSVILDGFGGTGTTALVAHVMGRHGITIDLSADYCRLAAWRTTDPGQLAQAALVEKPPAQTVGQDTLFEVTG